MANDNKIVYTMHDVRNAVSLAFELFGERVRKGDGTPYVGHLLRVTGLVMEGGGSLRAQVGAALHDVLEDIDGGRDSILVKFDYEKGKDIVELVEECSETTVKPKPEWRKRKEAHLKTIDNMSVDALRITLADKADNGRSLVSLCMFAGDQPLAAFNASPEDIVWYYAQMYKRLHRRMQDLNGVAVQLDDLRYAAENLADLCGVD